MEQVTVIIVGNGDRANCYCKFSLNHPESLKVAAIVDPSERKRREGAEKKTFNPHGVCAYKTGSDIVDHQAVVLHFANGSTATHTMIQGTVVPRRLTRIVGTKGEIEGSLDACKFTVYKYDFDKAWYTAEEVDIRERIAKDDHHAGGDDGIIRDFVSRIRGGKTSISCTKIQDSIYGHLCVFMADASMEEQEEKEIK